MESVIVCANQNCGFSRSIDEVFYDISLDISKNASPLLETPLEEKTCATHGCPLTVRTVKKETENKGRKFWTCPLRDCTDETNFEWYIEPPEIPLNQLVSNYFAAQELECTCSKCGHKTSTAQFKLTMPPNILILHLKRFSFDPLSGRFHKVTQPVSIESQLDVSSFRKMSSEDGKKLRYTLKSVVYHVGQLAQVGHYITDASSSTGKWQRFDDSRVREIEETTVLGKGRHGEGYMYFFQLEQST